MYYQKHISSQRTKRCRRTITVLLMLFVFLGLNAAVHRVVDGLLETEARRIINEAVNAAVLEVVNGDCTTESFVVLNKSEDGVITSAETNTYAVNDFRARISDAIDGKLNDYEMGGVRVPVGSLTGLDMLAGYGPGVELKLVQQGSIVTDLVSSFGSAGINQTFHRIDCTINAKFNVVIPGFTTSLEFDTSVMIAQSVIVGAVPDSFTNVNGDKNDTIGRIFDYGDPYGEDIQQQDK